MHHKVPILLSFYAISGRNATLLFGQVTHTSIRDLSFKDYSRRKTFRTLVSLYRTKPYANENIKLIFDEHEINGTTDAYGSFTICTADHLPQSGLQKAVLSSGAEIKIIEGLYPTAIQQVHANTIVVSDIDDTLLHSFIYRKVKKIRTLMFTTMEKRRTVVSMKDLMHQFTDKGAVSFYLSNSEQNLYPMIYRFLLHNSFPPGPLFLKKMRGFWDVIRNIKFPLRNIHKEQTLESILSLFPDKQFVLMGDNTQHDLLIYLQAAEKFPNNIRYIIIRKVIKRNEDQVLISKNIDKLIAANIKLFYADHFPSLSEAVI
jgi:phosphatidate phosphatase APP1